MALPPTVLRRLTREIAQLHKSPPDGIAIEIGEHDLLDVNGWVKGPAGTPYAGGYFCVNLSFVGSDFPAGPPRCTMRTKVFHPNIAANGEICVSTLKRDWSASYGIEHILVVIKCLLISPNPDSALDPEAGRLLQDAYSDYASTAAIWTRVHATYRPECMAADLDAPTTSQAPESPSRNTSNTSSVDLDPTIASFQALALHPHKKREVSGAKSTQDAQYGQRASAAPVSYTYGSAANGPNGTGIDITSQPLQRSGSTNAELKHKSSFDIAAQSGSGLVSGPSLPIRNTGPSFGPTRNTHEAGVLTTLPSPNADADYLARRLRNVSLDVPCKDAMPDDATAPLRNSTTKDSARRMRVVHTSGVVRRGIKRL